MSWARSVARGARLRCPACGVGRVSPRWFTFFTTADTCTACGASFEPGRGEFTGALMFGWGFFLLVGLFGYFWLAVFVVAPAWVQTAWLVAVGLSPAVVYRHVKGAWIGLMHAGSGLGPPPP